MIPYCTTPTLPSCPTCNRDYSSTCISDNSYYWPVNTIDVEKCNRQDRRTLESIAKKYGWKIINGTEDKRAKTR